MDTRWSSLAAVLMVTLLVSACGDSGKDVTSEVTSSVVQSPPEAATNETSTTSTIVPTTTTTTIDPYESDVAAIKSLFRGLSDSWLAGPLAGLEYTAANNYPGMGNTAQDCFVHFGGQEPPDGYEEEHIVDPATIERDDGWTIPDGPIAGRPLQGRVYIFTDHISVRDPEFGPSEESAEVHATVLDDGSVKFFFACYP